MNKNMGSIDRIIRGIVGLGLIVAGVLLQINQNSFWWLALVGSILVVTASISFCPLYLPFKISTIKKEK